MRRCSNASSTGCSASWGTRRHSRQASGVDVHLFPDVRADHAVALETGDLLGAEAGMLEHFRRMLPESRRGTLLVRHRGREAYRVAHSAKAADHGMLVRVDHRFGRDLRMVEHVL